MYDDGMEEVAEHEHYVKRPFDPNRTDVTPRMTERIASMAVASPSGSIPGTPVPTLDLGSAAASGVPDNTTTTTGSQEDEDDVNEEYLSINALLHNLALERANRSHPTQTH